MNGFSDKVKQKLGYYVYALADPRDNKIFYIGKGINNRIFQHEEKLDNSNKSNRIKEILSSGNKIKKLIISYGLSEKEAFVAESALINIIDETSRTYQKENEIFKKTVSQIPKIIIVLGHSFI